MFDAINGIPLNNADKKWDVEKSSTFRSDVTFSNTEVAVPGRAGYVSVGESREAATAVVAVITPNSRIEELRTLMSVPRPLLSVYGASREAEAVLKSITTKNMKRENEPWVVLSALYEIPAGCTRDVDESTTSVAIESASVVVEPFPGISAPVVDAVVRVKGGVTGLRVQDSGGGFFEYTAVLAEADYLRFEAESGRAWVTDTDTWTGGVEVTGDIRHGRPPYPLAIAPYFTDPAARVGRLTVTSTGRVGSPVVAVRGKGAYLV